MYIVKKLFQLVYVDPNSIHRVLGKLVVAQLDQKFIVIYANRRFVVVFTRAHHRSIS
jgi:DNA-directed RNA polymerase subunit E'/Rpb7